MYHFPAQHRLDRAGARKGVVPFVSVLFRLEGQASVSSLEVEDALTYADRRSAEPVTIPRYWKGILSSSNLFYTTSETANVLKSAAVQVDNGVKTIRQAAESVMSDLASGNVSVAGDLEVPPLFVLATGKKGTRHATVALTVSAIPVSSLEGASLMAAVTGIPFSVGLKMLCEGSITRRGVLAPEAALDPNDFFGELLPCCTYPRPVSLDQLVVVAKA